MINIYIETSHHGTKPKDGAYLYLIEYIDHNDQPITRGGICFTTATENQMVLQALIRALARITKPAEVRVFTGAGHVLGALKNEWPKQWQAAGWKNAKGKAIRNADLWEQLLPELEKHTIESTNEEHSYKAWMETEIKRRIGQHDMQ